MKKILLIILSMVSLSFAQEVDTIKILPRQDAATDGAIKQYEIYASTDKLNWGAAIGSGTIVEPATKSEKTIKFTKTAARHLKLKIISEASGSKNASISELNILDIAGNQLDRSKWTVSADISTEQTGVNWGKPNFAIDGNPMTFWITKWETGGTPMPHEFLIDLGERTITPPIVVPPEKESSPILVLNWNANPESNISTYILSYGLESKIYSNSISVAATTITIPGLLIGKTYYFAVKAKNSEGGESPYSDELVVKIIDKNFPSAPMPPEIPSPKRFVDVLMSTDGGATYKSIGMVPYPVIVGQKYKTLVITEKDPLFPSTTRFINVLMLLPGQTEYKSIGKVPYPVISGQKYKSTVYTAK